MNNHADRDARAVTGCDGPISKECSMTADMMLVVPRPSMIVVSQADLVDFLQLREQFRRHKEARDRLLALLEAGAPVELGPLTARVRRVPRQLLCPRTLTPVLGEDRVQELLTRVEPTVYRFLDVTGPGGTRP